MKKFDELFNKIITEWNNRQNGDWDDYGQARYPGERYNGELWRQRARQKSKNKHEWYEFEKRQREKQNEQIKQDRELGFQNISVNTALRWQVWLDFDKLDERKGNKWVKGIGDSPQVKSFHTKIQESQAKLVPGAYVNLAIKNYKYIKPEEDLLIFPYAIIDKVKDGIVEFHIDPKKYRELKELNYQVKTTNVLYQYLKLHPQDEQLKKDIQRWYNININNTTGIQLRKFYNLFYKIYGKEQGQLFHFRVPLKCVAIYEDVINAWDIIIQKYLETEN